MKHSWLKGDTATDYDVLPEIKSYIAKARLRRGVEMIKLKNRIEALKMQEDDDTHDLPKDAAAAAAQGVMPAGSSAGTKPPPRLSRAARSAIFREVVLAKVREMKEHEAREKAERTLSEKSQASRRR